VVIHLTFVTFTDGQWDKYNGTVFIKVHRSHDVAIIRKWHVCQIYPSW